VKRVLLALIGLAAGVGIGLLLGWNVWPVEYYDTEILALHSTYKSEYAVMVGAAYELDGDWQRAADRLAALGETDIGAWLRDLIHESIAAGRDPISIRYLIGMADRLGVRSDIMEPFAGQDDG